MNLVRDWILSSRNRIMVCGAVGKSMEVGSADAERATPHSACAITSQSHNNHAVARKPRILGRGPPIARRAAPYRKLL